MDSPRVLNRGELLGHEPYRLRADAVEIIESAIRKADPYEATKRLVRLEDHLLRFGALQYDLRERKHIYVLGAGKASHGIALALEEILGDTLSEGIVILKNGEPNQLHRIRVIYASHPIPDENSLRGAGELLALAGKAQKDDLVISIITGGSSALAVLPPPGVSLAEKQVLNRALLSSGASIREINAVRKHVSLIKGGRLAEAVFPAELVVLTVSDVIGDALDYITDPTVPDSSSYLDAWNTLDKYQLWDQLPESICRYLKSGADVESPKSFSGTYHPFILLSGDAGFEGAVQRCIELGYETTCVGAEIEGESSLQARALVDLAMKAAQEPGNGKARAWIGRGETIVTLSGPCGEGGPNQEFGLSAAAAIHNQAGIVAASVDLDGTDGPTVYSGALVDGNTVSRARQHGLDAQSCLNSHASTAFLSATQDLIFTGPTGTNVNDLMFILIDRAKSSPSS